MKKILLTVAGFVFLALMIGNVYACCCPCCTPGFTPGFWKHNIGVALGYTNGAFSAFEGGPLDGQKVTLSLLNDLAATVGVSLQTAYTVMSTGGGGAIAQARIDMANAFNAAAGYGPFVD